MPIILQIESSYSTCKGFSFLPYFTYFPTTYEKVNSSRLSFSISGSKTLGETGKQDSPGNRASYSSDAPSTKFKHSANTHPIDQISILKS